MKPPLLDPKWWIYTVLVSLIVGLITNYLYGLFVAKFSARSKYLNQVNKSNEEIVENLRGFISQKGSIDVDLMESIMRSISMKNNVSVGDIMRIEEFIDVLVTEIVNTPYLTVDQKISITDELKMVKSDVVNRGMRLNDYGSSQVVNIRIKRRDEMLSPIYGVLASAAAVMIASLATLLQFMNMGEKDNEASRDLAYRVIFGDQAGGIMLFIGLILSASLAFGLREFRREARRRK